MVDTEGILKHTTDRGELLQLGAKNHAAIARLAKHIEKTISSHEPVPKSMFAEWAADRVTGRDRQDLVLFLQGRRGSGIQYGIVSAILNRKSYSALYWGQKFAEAISRRKGGVWQDYFNINNCCTLENSEAIMKLLQGSGKYQIVLIDDCSLAIGNRSFQSPENKNFNALLSVCRTRRWIMILTAPLKKHTDNQTRDMCDLTGTIAFSDHQHGWNCVKLTRSNIGASGKEYTARLSFNKLKVDYWITLRPDDSLLEEYDRIRDSAAEAVNNRIVETGSFKPEKKKGPNRAEQFRKDLYERIGEDVKKDLLQNPKVSINTLCGKYGTSFIPMKGLLTMIEQEGNNGNR